VKHAVLTSVNRDELKDRGAEIWYQTVVKIKESSPQTTIETLIPDVKANWDALERMISAGQEVVSHNMETVESLYRKKFDLAKDLKKNFPQQLLDETKVTFGIPDAYDQGGRYLRYKSGQVDR
ncbi:unnamed protein product, partial [Darwinula stevensoni]